MAEDTRTQEQILKDVYDRAQTNRFAKHNHLEITVMERDHVEVVVDITPEALNAGGTVQGGLYFTMADYCGATCARTDGRRYVTQSANVYYLRSVKEGRITAKSNIIKRGRVNVLSEVGVYDAEDRLLFSATIDMFCIGD